MDSIVLDSIFISSHIALSKEVNPNAHSISTKEFPNATSVAQLISNKTSSYIKTNSPGGFSTSSLRGGSASQTSVIWNGFNIESPMLGQLDLSLLPTTFVDEVVIEYGGKSNFNGSGAIGGTINLNNQMSFKDGLDCMTLSEVGSFGQYNQGVKLKVGSEKWYFDSRLHYKNASNDFPFQKKTGIIDTMSNAATKMTGWINSLNYKPNENQLFSLHTWLVNNDQEIPPRIVQTTSKASQQDNSKRILLKYDYSSASVLAHIKMGYSNEFIDYRDSLFGVFAKSDFTRFMTEIGGQKKWNGMLKSSMAINREITSAFAEEYDERISEEKVSLTFAQNIKSSIIESTFAFRNEWRDGVRVASVPSLRLLTPLNIDHLLFLNLEKSYRHPTLNDRYWMPGGNMDLAPEQGWNGELGYKSSFSYKNLKNDFLLSGYYRRIKNWILWSRLPGAIYWSPSNITSVTSKGVDARWSSRLNIASSQQFFSIGYNFTKSTNDMSIDLPDIPEGQQLFYTPIHSFNLTYSVQYKKWRIEYAHKSTSDVIGVNANVDGYSLGSMKTNYDLDFGAVEMNVYLQLQNLWDTSYSIVEYRPMPGRNWSLGVNCTFKK